MNERNKMLVQNFIERNAAMRELSC